MRILDRYIIHSIAKTFASAIVLFCTLYVVIDLATNMVDFISNKIPATTIAAYYATFFPIIFVQTSPIACLLATLFTYSTLNNNNELIALRASGFDFWKTTRPAIIFGLIVTAFVFMINERFVPEAQSASQEIKSEQIDIGKDQNLTHNKRINNLFFYGLNNRLIFIDTYHIKEKEFDGITIIEQNNKQHMIKKISALKGASTNQGWQFENCQITHYNPENQSIQGDVQFFKSTLFKMDERPQDLLKQRAKVSAMNIHELSKYIKRFKSSGAARAINNLKVDLHQRIAYPFACIVIIFVGLPFALMNTRRKGLTFASIGIAIGIGFLFFVVNSVGLALGKSGALSPLVSAWFAPLLFICSSIFITKKLF